jgi:hypothetical protein
MYAPALTFGLLSIVLHTIEGVQQMNQLSFERRTQIINCLIEGNSIRSIERMTDTHRDTITRLLVQVGDGCSKLLDNRMPNLDSRRIQVMKFGVTSKRSSDT